jgi:hypothetical protein
MANISEYIHEVIAVIVFAAAVSLLIFLTDTMSSADSAADQSMRNRTNIAKGVQMTSNEQTATGAQVYTDILEYAKDHPDLEISIKFSENAGDTYTVTREVRTQFTDNNSSQDLMKVLVNSSKNVNLATVYYKTFVADDNGNIISVRYEKQ